ncbi:MAG: type I glutamate--ammonia ligase [Bacillota bacterium]
MSKTRADILKEAEERNITSVRLQFADIFGIVKNMTVPASQLERALDGELMFDGSSIDGFVRVEESDMYFRPDYSTFTVLPWLGREGTVARLICDVSKSDGTPFVGCPRHNLKRILNEAEKMNYHIKTATESEFFFFLSDEHNRPKVVSHDEAGYFDLDLADKGADARREIMQVLGQMGYEVEASHHEVAVGQHEITFKYADALTTADATLTFKWVVKAVAKKNGLHATFMPKPFAGKSGSGMHTNQSLFKGETNIFYDEKDPFQLSGEAYHYIAGLLKNARSFSAVTNPLVNSYKRLVPGYEAPVYISWSAANRSALIRIPVQRGLATRIELRCPDPAANPYLAFAAMIKAGMQGIINQTPCPRPIEENIYEMSATQKRRSGVGNLPRDLGEAVDLLKKSRLMREALGEHIYSQYIKAKEKEWERYCRAVHQWEYDAYLAKY